MQSFAIKPNSFKEIRKATLIRLVPVLAALLLISIVLNVRSVQDPGQADTWLIMIFLITGVFSYSIYTTLKRQKQMLESYRLTITHEDIIREQVNTPDIKITRKSVKEIVKAKNGAFAVIGESKLNAIMIPAQIEQPERLEQLLSEIKPITFKTGTPGLQKLLLPLALIGMFLLFWGFSAESILIFSLCGLGILGIMTAGFVVIQRSKNVDRRMKRISYMFLIPILSILTVVIMKWVEG